MATLAERIQKHVIISLSTGCWLWSGATDPDGYGQISVTVGGKSKTKQAHIASYEDRWGPVPAGLEIDHKCQQRACVNPDPAHLEAVTHAENVRRMAVAQRKLKGVPEIDASIDVVEAGLMRTLRIDPAKCEGFRLNDLAPDLMRMLTEHG